MGKRTLLLVLGALFIGLMMTSVALAYTTQNVYDDFSDNGKLDKHYSDAELRDYLNDATLHQYGDHDKIHRLDDLVNDMLTRDTFPFTGFQLMIAGIVAVALVGGGIALRRFSRPQKS
jgi:hypothetical protein